MEQVNLKQLANKLGLSSSTVSRALQDSHRVSQATKLRVKNLAEAYNYRPNPHARSLREQQSKTIAVVVPKVATHIIGQSIDGIEAVARRHNYHVLLYLTHANPAQEVAVAHYLLDGRVDGVLYWPASGDQAAGRLPQLLGQQLPLVVFGSTRADALTTSVTTDDYHNSYDATAHLLAGGARCIAQLLAAGSAPSLTNPSVLGYAEALRARGLPFRENLVVCEAASAEQTQLQLQALLLNQPQLDGLLATTESLVLRCYRACQQLGRRIPDDIQLVGLAPPDIAALFSPPLTTLSQPGYTIGEEAATLLLRALTTGRPLVPSQSRQLRGVLVARASTHAVAPLPSSRC
ncbi:MAG: LacI family DNA-binding transcriptional regulator [Janthinobacterium lividum]